MQFKLPLDLKQYFTGGTFCIALRAEGQLGVMLEGDYIDAGRGSDKVRVT